MSRKKSILFFLLFLLTVYISYKLEPQWSELAYEGDIVFPKVQGYYWVFYLIMGLFIGGFLALTPHKDKLYWALFLILALLVIYILGTRSNPGALSLIMSYPRFLQPLALLGGLLLVDYFLKGSLSKK